MTFAVTVTNTGSRHGTEVVQIYATLPSAASAEPRHLVAFGKVSLDRGAAQRLVFTIAPEDLMVWDSGNWTLIPGLYTFAAARASRDITGQRTLTIG